MARWADFSAGRPTAAALIKAGFTGVLCYIGLGSAGKRITRAQYEDYSRSGLQVLLVAELGTNDAWASLDDYATGVARAQVALAEARALGIPDYVGIACAADAHAQRPDGSPDPAKIADAVQYARGFAAVLGKARTGFYGFAETSRAVHDAGVVGWHWRCGSAPSTADRAWVNLWQRNTPPTVVTVDGIPCDINDTIAPIASQEDDMRADEPVISPITGESIAPYTDVVFYTNYFANMIPGLHAKLDALGKALSDDEANIIAAMRAGAGIDLPTFANLLAPVLAPMIHAGATPEQVQSAAIEGVRQAFARAGQEGTPA